ncbi:MAG TPA: ribosomal protein S18-alanine N-acetyltransferase [Dehalococcoidia bacterium]|nr:ribosomal protein S18-alanine N-acetyltransferase [Dehalococcoidia bacterium]
MAIRDIPQVMEIEREAFPTMWPRTAFQREIEQNHLARYLVATRVKEREEEEGDVRLPPEFAGLQPGEHRGESKGLAGLIDGLRQMVGSEESLGGDLPDPGEREELVVGFVGNWLMVGESHIVSIAVREDYRGQGIGELLIIAAVSIAMENSLSKVSLECRISNYVALSLYEKYRFKQVGVRSRYYSDNHEDAYIMLVDGVDSDEYRQFFQQLQDDHRRGSGSYEIHL